MLGLAGANAPQERLPLRLLLLIPTRSYRTHDFMEAARRADCDVVVGSNLPQILARFTPDKTLVVNFRNGAAGLRQILRYAARYPLVGIVGVDEETTVLAAQAAEALGLPHNPPAAVQLTRNKFRLRRCLAESGLPSPPYWLLPLKGDGPAVTYPCVLKPLSLSASRGVMRVDGPGELAAARGSKTCVFRFRSGRA